MDLAIEARTNGEIEGKSSMEEVEKWSKMLINENSNYFIARTIHKNQEMKLLINTKH